MLLIAHESRAAAEQSAAALKALGSAAIRLMAESVEHTGVTRKVLSAAARALEKEGFLFVRDGAKSTNKEYGYEHRPTSYFDHHDR